jgi:hypothetical protein
MSILNPYLLAVPEMYTRWDKGDVDAFDADNLGSSRYCAPRYLRWHPHNQRAEVWYNAACMMGNNVWYFSLNALNARDLNLNYIYVSYEDSINITKDEVPTRAYRNPQFLHQGGSCGYPGGCNNISPRTPPIDNIQATGWPAQIVVWFWRSDPGTVDTAPEMEYVITFD